MKKEIKKLIKVLTGSGEIKQYPAYRDAVKPSANSSLTAKGRKERESQGSYDVVMNNKL